MVCLALTACATPVGLSEKLDRSVKSFNRMLRWHEIENAGTTFIDPEQQTGYQKQAEILKKTGISVTDFRILTTRYNPDKKSADVVAEFDYFILPSNRIKTISYRQEWLYRENVKEWKLQSGLPTFE
jgi:hypothetical protein